MRKKNDGINQGLIAPKNRKTARERGKNGGVIYAKYVMKRRKASGKQQFTG